MLKQGEAVYLLIILLTDNRVYKIAWSSTVVELNYCTIIHSKNIMRVLIALVFLAVIVACLAQANIKSGGRTPSPPPRKLSDSRIQPRRGLPRILSEQRKSGKPTSPPPPAPVPPICQNCGGRNYGI